MNQYYTHVYTEYYESQHVTNGIDKESLNISQYYKPHATFLDVGCATGYICNAASLEGFDAHGIDVNEKQIEFAKRTFPNCHFMLTDLLEADFGDNYFDIVRIWHCIEHVADPLSTLRKLYAIAKPGGTLILGTHNISCPNLIIRNKILNILGYIPTPPSSDHHTYDFTPKTLGLLIKRAGWNNCSIRTYPKEIRPLWKSNSFNEFRHSLILKLMLPLAHLPNLGQHIVLIATK